ncbi:hypothetical protein OS121_26335 [Mycolicibacterium mucogenicum]|uniref:Kelch repeat-containing protein n=1 Tax=Mycolicibacterium mucogenicum TaxID=56689 RepID=UPI00226A6066|nr:kelch motif-containing protein [Mycolicibacterium mucogenicum]MCX8558573.1 hypothetical protein [Mycolicibacterium mucogenicum]
MPWQTKPPLSEEKTGLAAVTADAPAPETGSRIYAIGGWTGFKDLNTVEVFDTQANVWTTVAPMPTARFGMGAAVSAGRIHVVGGHQKDVGVVTTHEVYEPATNTWSQAAPMPTARYWLDAATAPDGLVYAIGGLGSNAYNTVEAYDPVADSWTTRAPMPTGRQGLATVLGPDGLIYAIAGFHSPNLFATVETYDPAADTWSSAPSLPKAVNWLGAAVGPNGLIYAMGGASGGNNEARHEVYSYDPATPAAGWSTRAPMLAARSDLAAATGPDGLVYALAGNPQEVGNGFHDSVEAYTFAPNDGVSIEGLDVADILKDLVGKTVGGVDRGGGGGIIIGGHYIPIPPRSPIWAKILRAAQPYLDHGVDSPQLGQLVEQLQRRPGQALKQPNLGARAVRKQL